jgi:hypothetical protein
VSRRPDTPIRQIVSDEHLCFVVAGQIIVLTLAQSLLRDAAHRRNGLAAHQIPELNRSEAECLLLGIGFWTAVDELDRAVSALEQRHSGLSDRLTAFKDDRAEWRRMRDDSAHAFDRLYRELRRGANDPEDPVEGARSAWYNSKLDQFETGSAAHMKVADVVACTDELAKATRGFFGLSG